MKLSQGIIIDKASQIPSGRPSTGTSVEEEDVEVDNGEALAHERRFHAHRADDDVPNAPTAYAVRRNSSMAPTLYATVKITITLL